MKFERDRTVETREPKVEVDPGLEPGKYRFQLVVEDRDGQRSQPADCTVTIERTT